MTDFDIVGPEAIAAGRATDAYFERTAETLAAAGRNPHVVAEVTADQFSDGGFELLAGSSWEQEAKITAPTPDANANFGGEVALDDTMAAKYFDVPPANSRSTTHPHFACTL